MRRFCLAACLAALALAPAAATAQIGIAPQISRGDDSDFGVGARLAFRLPTQVPLELTGAFDFFFPSEDFIDSYWEVNANVNYIVEAVESLFVPYVGGGLNVAGVKTKDAELPGGGTIEGRSDTEIGANLLGGIRYLGTAATPYVEVRYEINGGEQVVFTLGLIFSIGPGL